jgi:light-regulated signal transduction histidine kinase (bacteriophytochrome)
LRSPLKTINGFSLLLGKKLAGDTDPKVQHYLSRIQAGTAHMDQLIEGLLSLTQVSRAVLRSEPVDLSMISRSILDDCQARHPGRKLMANVEYGLQARGDARLVKAVMENLLGNAWKFSSKKACAEIAVGQIPGSAESPVFFVRDNGAGFDMAHVDKLFSPFERLHEDSEFPGMGIGLATVSRIIERHHGRLWAESVAGCGASFFFTLPAGAVQ